MDKLKPITLFLIIIFSIYFLSGCTLSKHDTPYGGIKYTSQYTDEELVYLKSYYGYTPTLKREPYGWQRELERWEFLYGGEPDKFWRLPNHEVSPFQFGTRRQREKGIRKLPIRFK